MPRILLRWAPCRHAARCRGLATAAAVERSLDAIARDNARLNAVASARAREDASAPGPSGSAGPLEGWPVAVKANIATTWGATSCASRALEDYRSPFAATAVEALERAGAAVVAKTNMDEFGMGSKNTFGIYGPAHNPHRAAGGGDLHSPGGSSGGSAAAVAAGLCRAALGSDTGGSVRLPAAWCGVVGFKPTYGRVSRRGLVAYGSSLDAVGVLAQTVDDAGAVYRAMAVPDPRDMTCMSPALRRRIAALAADTRPRMEHFGGDRPLAGLRIGVPREAWVDELSAAALDAWRAGAARLAALGCEVVAVSLPHTRHALPAYYTLALAEASSNLARYDGVRYGSRSASRAPPPARPANASLKYAATRGEGLGAEVQRRILLGTYVMSEAACRHFYRPSQRIRRLVQQDFDAVFALPNALHAQDTAPQPSDGRRAGVDAILLPTATDTAPRQGRAGEEDLVASYVNDVMTVSANLAGIPAIAVPAGRTSGMPLGLQLAAQYGDDDLLLQIARHLHQ
ncbi:Trimeric GatFAB AmidoTransferase(AdT) complex subunit [Coemansia nantahalensis]|uniref:Trimeric GatFAB AmidoTransferase(AdT) complex subunit n=1 Tax=Coemansia nantahalensis TaxID=2789366 RepID=A0ACC1K1B8_9FUNG|nr:Trimeric GatFAB AmidoTransferase(AdT) complex subunit [Coemansia nantahalensis]